MLDLSSLKHQYYKVQDSWAILGTKAATAM